MKKSVTKEIQARARNGGTNRRYALVNRIEGEALRRLANVGWTDEARAASLAARRANSTARYAEEESRRSVPSVRQPVGGIRANGRYRTENGKTVFMPDGASSMPPAGNGDLVKTGDGIMLMVDGKPVRLGSTKVLSIGPDGNLLLSIGSRSLDLGKPDKLGKFMVSRNGAGTLLRTDNCVYVRFGDVVVSLEDGSVRGLPVRTRTDSRGAILRKLPEFDWQQFEV